MIAVFIRLLGAIFVLLVMAGAPSPGRADSVIVLTVAQADDDTQSTWSLAQLQALPEVAFETTTPFTDGLQHFVGVSLLDVLGEIAPEAILTLRALNDYSVVLPVADVTPTFPVIAYARNGAVMSVRDNGPLWLVYPFDHAVQYQNELTYSRSIWQLTEIRIDR